MLNQIIRICTKYMSIGVVLAGIFSIFWPEVMKPFAPKIPTLLGIIMFGMGMSLTPGDFRNVFKQPKNVAIGTVLQFIIMPAAAFALIHLFALPPEIAIGVVLVGCCPGGTASNVISYIAKADVALSVSMTMVNTILAPFVTPFLVWLIAGAWVDIDFMSMMMSHREDGAPAAPHRCRHQLFLPASGEEGKYDHADVLRTGRHHHGRLRGLPLRPHHP